MLTFTADRGAITGNAFSYTPNSTGKVTIIITANDERSTANISFALTVNDNVKALDASSLSKTIVVKTEVIIEDVYQYFLKGLDTDVLVFNANKGEIVDGKWTYTPQTVGQEIITITANDGEKDAQITFTLDIEKESGCAGCSSSVMNSLLFVTLILMSFVMILTYKRKWER